MPTPTDATRSPRATTPSGETPACALTGSQGTDTLTVPDALVSLNELYCHDEINNLVIVESKRSFSE